MKNQDTNLSATCMPGHILHKLWVSGTSDERASALTVPASEAPIKEFEVVAHFALLVEPALGLERAGIWVHLRIAADGPIYPDLRS